MDLFTEAVKTGVSFSTERGQLLPQQVWQLPLTGNNGFNLDTISRSLLKKVRSVEEKSLVTEVKVDTTDELRLEILKFIIKDKQEDQEASKLALANKQKKQQLLALKANKQTEALNNLSEEDIDKQLAELG